MDLKRLQELAEPFGWKIEEQIHGYTVWYSKDPDDCEWYKTLTPIRTRLEAEYRKLAEQSVYIGTVINRLHGHPENCNSQCKTLGYAWLTEAADELAVKEPTMVENPKLKKLLSIEVSDHTHQSILAWAVECIVDLYERKEK